MLFNFPIITNPTWDADGFMGEYGVQYMLISLYQFVFVVSVGRRF